MLPLPPVLALLPHRPPWLLIDRVVSVAGDVVVAEKRVSAGDPLVGACGLAGLLLIEALAQTAACLMGATHAGADESTGGSAGESNEAGEHRGYLVAARGWKFPSIARPGETLTLTATKRVALGGLHGFAGVARVGERVVAAGEMTFAVTFEPRR